jgi:cystathionine gamma-lyase
MIYKSILDLIGNTPTVEVSCFETGRSKLFLKLESQNPGGSIKDRIGLHMIEAAEKEGRIKPGDMLIEATAGNTGIGLALVAAKKGYRLTLVIPDKMSDEKIRHLNAMGVNIVMTRSDVGKGHPEYYQDYALRLSKEIPGSFYVNQFENPANPHTHEIITGPEIWEQMGHEIDAIVIGVGSAGTIGGLTRYFSKVKPEIEFILADPEGSVLKDYFYTRKVNKAGSWVVEGIGEDFVPANCDFSLVKHAYSVSDKEAIGFVRELLLHEGIFAGSSTGVLIGAALKYAREQKTPKRILTFVADTGNKYLSKIYNDSWLQEHGLSVTGSAPGNSDLSQKKPGFSTRSIHAGQDPETATGAIVTPIYATSTFAQESPGKHKGYEYSRGANPTRSALEKCMASLENGTMGFAFSSGMAAENTILELLESGSHILAMEDLYGGTYRLFERVKRTTSNLEVTYLDLNDQSLLQKSIRSNTRMIWIETPTNPLLKLVDLSKVVAFAKQHDLLTVCDNTFASPALQNPLDHGIDIVVHSATKYLNGHADIVAGIVVVNEQNSIGDRMRYLQFSTGAILSPFDSFLLLRGVKTLAVRMKVHNDNAMKIATFLEKHPQVEKVIYPGLPSFPQHTLANRQMRGFGGMISFTLKCGIAESRKFLSALKLFTLAESLGGVESLIELPALMTHASIPRDKRYAQGITDNLVRISVGIEDAADLVEDLQQALATVEKI